MSANVVAFPQGGVEEGLPSSSTNMIDQTFNRGYSGFGSDNTPLTAEETEAYTAYADQAAASAETEALLAAEETTLAGEEVAFESAAAAGPWGWVVDVGIAVAIAATVVAIADATAELGAEAASVPKPPPKPTLVPTIDPPPPPIHIPTVRPSVSTGLNLPFYSRKRRVASRLPF